MMEYYLILNKLTPEPDDCVARTHNTQTLSLDDIIKRMTGRGLTLTDTEVKSVFNELTHVLNDALQQGNSISTPFLKVTPSIAGVFENADDLFDSSRHTVKLNASLGNDIKVDQRKFSLRKVRVTANMPEILKIRDYQTQRDDEVLSRKGTVELRGLNLKLDAEDKEQGIFIANDGQEVRAEVYMHNKPSQIIFLVPENAPGGDVRLIIRNRHHNGASARQATFEKTLTLI